MDEKCLNKLTWIDSPKELVTNLTIVPDRNMNMNELVNTMTRIIIIISLILLVTGFAHWWVFLIAGIALILAMWYLASQRQPSSAHTRIEYYRPTCGKIKLTPKRQQYEARSVYGNIKKKSGQTPYKRYKILPHKLYE